MPEALAWVLVVVILLAAFPLGALGYRIGSTTGERFFDWWDHRA